MAVSSQAFAQENESILEEEAHYGVKAGINFAELWGQDALPERLENFETFDFSLNVGLGYEVAEDWVVGLRYGQGLTRVVDNRDLRNSVIYLGAAYRVF